MRIKSNQVMTVSKDHPIDDLLRTKDLYREKPGRQG